jgi:hypothetical protein
VIDETFVERVSGMQYAFELPHPVLRLQGAAAVQDSCTAMPA